MESAAVMTGFDMTTDLNGNTISVGSAFYIVKYDSLGEVMWDHSMVGDYNADVDCDPSGNIVIAGENGRILKFGPAGDILWEIDLEDSGLYEIYDVVCDSQGSIYLAGGGPFIIAKVDSNGTLLWTRTEVGLEATACDVDPYGDVIVAGTFWGEDRDWLIVKYSSEGEFLWEQRRTYFWMDIPRTVCVDDSGDVYVGGKWLVKYDGVDGREEWEAYGDLSFFLSVSIGIEGALYIGAVALNGGVSLACYDSTGHEIWEIPIFADGEGIVRTVEIWGDNNLSVLFAGGGPYSGQMFTARYRVQNTEVSESILPNADRLFLFPQPSFGILSIRIDDAEDLEEVIIRDLVGREISKISPVDICKGILCWDCRDYRGRKVTPGCYHVQAVWGDGLQMRKVAIILK